MDLFPLAAAVLLSACAAHGAGDPALSRALGRTEAGVANKNLAASPALKGWELVWSDEFNGPVGAPPDPAKWKPESGAGGWGNDELEFYCAPGSNEAPCDPSKPNAAQDGQGNLVIAAVRTPSGAWTSARFKTLGLQEFKYGRIEARIRLPTGAGLWPAFWLLGDKVADVGWPEGGEIDIMENVPGNVPGGLGVDVIKSTLHGPGYSGVHGVGELFHFPRGGRVDDGFHVYGAIWSPRKIQFYVDDASRPFFTVTPKSLPAGKEWVYDQPFFLIMNLAVGGSWPKDPDATTPNPARMLVDYVRVYRKR